MPSFSFNDASHRVHLVPSAVCVTAVVSFRLKRPSVPSSCSPVSASTIVAVTAVTCVSSDTAAERIKCSLITDPTGGYIFEASIAGGLISIEPPKPTASLQVVNKAIQHTNKAVAHTVCLICVFFIIAPLLQHRREPPYNTSVQSPLAALIYPPRLPIRLVESLKLSRQYLGVSHRQKYSKF